MKQHKFGITGTIVFVVILQAFFLLSPALAEQKKTISPEEIDTITTKIMKHRNIPGLSIAMTMADGTNITRSYGFAEVEHTVSVQSDSIFAVGSITKVLTAISIMMLQEQGKLSTADKLLKYFPDYPGGEDITIRHLLQHTSGIKEIGIIEPFKSNQMKDWTPQQLVAILKTQPLDFEPGQRAQYSNSGYILLGLIIEKITGSTYAEFVEKQIIKPLGMSNTMMGSNGQIIPRRAAGYIVAGKTLKNAEVLSLSSPYASGGLMSTSSDLVKLMRALKPGVLLKQKSIDEMTTPVQLNNGQEYSNITGTGLDFTYGYGLEMIKRGNVLVPGKTGSISGFNAYVAYYKDNGLTIAITSNLANSLFDILEIVRSIVGLMG